MRWIGSFGLLLCALAFTGTLVSCSSGMTDEDRVWAAVKDMADAAEKKDIGRLKDHISKSYRDPSGNDYDQLKGFILYHFMRSGDISVFLRKHEVSVKGDKAYVTVRAVISKGRKVSDVSEAEPGSTGGFIFDLEFERDGSDWLMSSAIWRQVSITEAL